MNRDEQPATALMYIDKAVLEKLGPETPYFFSIYEAERTEVVLGRSCKIEEDVLTLHCEHDGVPVLRRAGGGGTVVLSKGMIIISVAGRSTLQFHLREYMHAVNRRIIRALEALGVQKLSLKGISDVALGDRKILGCSLYKTKDAALYQGSLLLNPDTGLFNRYLKHPGKEPDYRCGRNHGDFITTLAEAGYRIGTGELIRELKRSFSQGSPWEHLERL